MKQEQRHIVPLTEEQYISSFATLYQPFENNRTTESQVIDTWTRTYLTTFTPRTILSIGAGTGTFDAFFINNLSKRLHYYCGIEPTPGHEKLLRKTMTNLSIPPKNITIITRPFDQNFHPVESECQHFDVILISHSLYCIPKPAEAIKHAMQFLNESGRIIVYNECFEGICEVYETFMEKFNLAWATPYRQDQTVSIEGVSADLRKLGVRHFMERVNSFLDVSSFFENDQAIVIEILNFIMQTDVTQLPEHYVQEMIDYVKDRSQFNAKSGWYEFYQPSGFIVVHSDKKHYVSPNGKQLH